MTDELRLTIDLVTFALAVLGAGLGVLNYVLAARQYRTRLKVTPMVAMVNGRSLRLAVKITNKSSHPVRPAQMCLLLRGTDVRLGFKPQYLPGDRGLVELAARASVTVIVPAGACQDDMIVKAYAVEVSCQDGTVAVGRSAALRWFVKHRPPADEADRIEDLDDTWGNFVASPHGPPKSVVREPQDSREKVT